jgi:hypothetical protein
MSNLNNLVHLNLEDAEAIAQNIEDNLQYDEDENKELWQAILTRLNISIRHATYEEM